MPIRTPLLVPTLFLIACATESSHPIELPPNGGVRDVVQVPAGATPFSGSTFVMTGVTAPGTASFTDAPLSDPNAVPPAYGSGSLSVTVNGQLYSAASIESASFAINDGAQDYLILGGYEIHAVGGVDHANQVFVIVRRSDFAVGATVDFDGQDRFAMFATGPVANQDPEILAAAVTGSITFTGGSITPNGTGTVTATVAGEFGEVEVTPPPPPPSGGSITAGSYTLAINSSADVWCDGTLAGQESAFAGITLADLGFTNGPVDIATSPSTSVSGAAITSAFGAMSLQLDPAGDGLVAGFTDESAANIGGPAGTTRVGKYLVLDASSASAQFVNGSVGAGYATDTGTCTVSFGASLSAP